MPTTITVTVCERPICITTGTSLFSLREDLKPNADITIFNGMPVSSDCILQESDEVVFIRRGEIPSPEELEALMAARHTPGIHRVLKAATVGIAGLGGLGSAVALALCRIGVGRLILADFDVV
ncbi:MAG: ThiF family adenylyltransferase, partial [Candidatus Hydrogenedentes bacterium]|nr:ThiF family adenylyltransferase [Candidatus Hydrogenedentota bacterium]